MNVRGISRRFRLLSPSEGQVDYALLTRSPLSSIEASFHLSPFDLHVLSTPPAFVLSQDQTLQDTLKPLRLILLTDLPTFVGLCFGFVSETRTRLMFSSRLRLSSASIRLPFIVRFSKIRVVSGTLTVPLATFIV